jgi:hypothetical protein
MPLTASTSNVPDVLNCMYEKHNVVSMRPNATCCDATTSLSATDNRDRLQAYVVHTVWLIEVRPHLQANNQSLFGYFSSRKTLVLSKTFGDVLIFKFG